jgi:hypothetical protein
MINEVWEYSIVNKKNIKRNFYILLLIKIIWAKNMCVYIYIYIYIYIAVYLNIAKTVNHKFSPHKKK